MVFLLLSSCPWIMAFYLSAKNPCRVLTVLCTLPRSPFLGREDEAPKGSRITVAVGTTITDRPPHRSVHARLRIRLLPRMNGVEALVGIRMQNTWVRNPPVEQWVETVPSHLRALTATN